MGTGLGAGTPDGGLEIAFSAELPVMPERDVAFVSAPRHWPLFFISMRAADADEDWDAPARGDAS